MLSQTALGLYYALTLQFLPSPTRYDTTPTTYVCQTQYKGNLNCMDCVVFKNQECENIIPFWKSEITKYPQLPQWYFHFSNCSIFRSFLSSTRIHRALTQECVELRCYSTTVKTLSSLHLCFILFTSSSQIPSLSLIESSSSFLLRPLALFILLFCFLLCVYLCSIVHYCHHQELWMSLMKTQRKKNNFNLKQHLTHHSSEQGAAPAKHPGGTVWEQFHAQWTSVASWGVVDLNLWPFLNHQATTAPHEQG